MPLNINYWLIMFYICYGMLVFSLLENFKKKYKLLIFKII